MSNNILNDISKVYLNSVVESAVPGKPAERLGAVTAIPKSDQDAARERTLAKAAAIRAKKGITQEALGGGVKKGGSYDRGYAAMQKQIEKLDKGQEPATAKRYKEMKNEGLDPVGKEDSDIDNDGKPNTKKDKYLMHRRNVIKQELATQKESKEVKKWWDDDGDGKGYEKGEVEGKFKKKKKVTKEGYSNWRQDLSEVITKDQNETPIKEKKVSNKIVINPPMKIGEAVSNLGGELVEMVEFEGVLDEFHDSELMFLSNELIEEVVEEFFYECLEEGYEIGEVEDMLIESIETSSAILNEAKVTLGHDTKIEKRNNKLEKVKSVVKKVARGVGRVAGADVRGAKAIGREVKAGYAAGEGSDSGSSETRKPQSYRNTHQKPGLLSRLGSKLKSGLKKAVASGARAVSRGARNVARKMEGGSSSSTPAPAAKPKAKKKPGKLDSLLADVRKEYEVELDEKINVGADAGATISDFVHSKNKTFKGDSKKQRINRALGAYYAAKKAKVNEAIAPTQTAQTPTSTSAPAPAGDKNKNQQLNNLKIMQQKQRQLQQQRFNLQKQGKLPIDTN